MAEILVAMTIIAVLVGMVLVAVKTLRNSGRQAAAEDQLALITKAIDQYAAFWPKWKVGSTTVAEQGWPDFIAGRLFDKAVFQEIKREDKPLKSLIFNSDLTFNVLDGIIRPTNRDYVGIGDVLSANICLAYALTAGSGKGPYLEPDDQTLLKDITDPQLLESFAAIGGGQDQTVLQSPCLPGYLALPQAGAKHSLVLVDPWGTPYRYFWAYRDNTAINGLIPVITADPTNAAFRPAVGYVLESAGPDRRFGNVWRANPTVQEHDDAEDNLIVKP